MRPEPDRPWTYVRTDPADWDAVAGPAPRCRSRAACALAVHGLVEPCSASSPTRTGVMRSITFSITYVNANAYAEQASAATTCLGKKESLPSIRPTPPDPR